MSDLVTVKVRRMHTNELGSHVEGDTYDTTKQHAALLASRQLVEVVDGKAQAAPSNKALSGAPENKSGAAAQISAADALKLAEGNFMTFKAAAKGVLGEGMPAKKAEIVAALQALTPPEGKFSHNGRDWEVVEIDGAFFARDDQGSDTGPYTTAEQAREWVLAIQP